MSLKDLAPTDPSEALNAYDPKLKRALDRVHQNIVSHMARANPANHDNYDAYRSWCVEQVEMLRVHRLYCSTLVATLKESHDKGR